MTNVISASTVNRARLLRMAAPKPTIPRLTFWALELMMASDRTSKDRPSVR